MEVTLAEQGIFLLPVRLTQEQARERALEQKFNVFGTVSKFLMRPKGEEIQLGLSEFRYTPFCHALGHKRFRFERRTRYQLPVSAQAESVEITGQTYTPTNGAITLQAQEQCLAEERNEVFLDALSGEVKDLRGYLKYDPQAVEDKANPDVALVPPEVRAADVIRRVLGDVLHPSSADRIIEETVAVESLDLLSFAKILSAFEINSMVLIHTSDSR